MNDVATFNNAREHLVALLCARQDAAGLSDQVFADRLGIGRSTWTLIRIGARHPGVQTVAAVRDAFTADPEIAAAVRAVASGHPFFYADR